MPTDLPFLVARIRARIQITNTTTLPDLEIVEWLNEAQERMVETATEWRALEFEREYKIGPTTDGVLLPANMHKPAGVFQKDDTQTDPSLKLIPIPNITRQQW